jgi:hypothetical protein
MANFHCSAFEAVKLYFEESTEAVMPTLYILLRGLSALESADDNMLLFNAPDCSGTSAIIDSRIIHVKDIGAAQRDLVDEARKELDRLLFNESLFTISDTKLIHDDPRVRSPGYGFTEDKRNAWVNKPSVLEHILTTPQLFAKFAYLNARGEVVWLPGACHQRLREIFDLQMLLCLGVLMSFGEPARGTELTSHLYRNVPGGSIRNVFCMFQTFVLRGSYNKTSHITGDRSMVRIPLPPIGRLFVRFLVFLRPLYAEWQRVFHPHMHANGEYFLFAGLYRPVTTADVSKALSRFTEQKLGVKLNLRKFRQYIAFITSCNSELFDLSQSATTAAHDQIGHTGPTDRAQYAGDARLPLGLDRSTFMSTARVSATMHILFGHAPELLTTLEAGNSSRAALAKTIMSIRRPESVTVVTETVPTTQKLAIQTIAEGVQTVLMPNLVGEVTRSLAESYASVVNLFATEKVFPKRTELPQLTSVMTHPYMLRQLRQFMGEGQSSTLGFRNINQALVTQYMYERSRHIAYISATGKYPYNPTGIWIEIYQEHPGSGKTIPGLLCAKYLDEGRTTVWILPLRSMHEQYYTRSHHYGMTCETWTAGASASHPPTNLLVTIESTQSTQFHHYMSQLLAQDRVARIVVDEAHLSLTHDSFRPVMGTLQWLGRENVQVVAQTATLPPSLEADMFEVFGISTYLVNRSATSRPNISHSVKRCLRANIQATLATEFRQAMGLSDTNRVMIFCLSRAEVEESGRTLGIPYCHSEMSQEAIDGLLLQFRTGKVRAIVATSILGVALDVPGVTHVFHVDYPRDALAFTQETGRVGRDAATPQGWSVIIAPIDSPVPKFPYPDRFGAAILRKSIDDDRLCRRIVVQLFIDGVAEPCSMMEGHTHLCDNCERWSRNEPIRGEDSSFPQDIIKQYLKAPRL